MIFDLTWLDYLVSNSQFAAFKIFPTAPVKGRSIICRGVKGVHFPPGFWEYFLNVLVKLVFKDKWPWNYKMTLKNLKHIKILTLLAVLFLFSAPLLVPMPWISNYNPIKIFPPLKNSCWSSWDQWEALRVRRTPREKTVERCRGGQVWFNFCQSQKDI